MLGITVVPKLDSDGNPRAVVVISGSSCDQVVGMDPDGVEMTFSHEDGQFHVVEIRGADAVSG